MARHGKAIMPWGKWRGVRIALLPNDYLSWLTTSIVMTDSRWEWLKDSLLKELRARGMNDKGALVSDETIPEPEATLPFRDTKVERRMVLPNNMLD